MPEVIVTHRSSASAETVWDVMTDIQGWVGVISGVDAVERLDDGSEFGPGLRWRETRTMFGKAATEEMEVTSVDLANRSYVVEAESHGTHYRSVLSVNPAGDGDGCTLAMSFAGEPQGRMGKLMAKTMGRAFEKGTRKALAGDLADLAAAAEARDGSSQA